VPRQADAEEPKNLITISLALKHAGDVVGCLGDGINDAPSLHAADVGISVDSAVDAAKDAADIARSSAILTGLHDTIQLAKGSALDIPSGNRQQQCMARPRSLRHRPTTRTNFSLGRP
jgi:high-affinity K+ transport system ATPase subunit B